MNKANEGGFPDMQLALRQFSTAGSHVKAVRFKAEVKLEAADSDFFEKQAAIAFHRSRAVRKFPKRRGVV